MVKLEEFCQVGDGAHASIKRCANGVKYLTAKNFTLSGLDLSKTEYISLEDYAKHFCKKSNKVINVKKDDLVFSIIGSIGSPYVVKDDDIFGLSSSVAILRPDKDKLISKFLYYWIKSDIFQEYIKNIKSGAAQGFISLEMIKKLPVLLMSISKQQKIVDILSAYDDLIENNNRRIELLEKVAQNLYKEWFVRFRFPNYKQTKFENGLPLGWEIVKLKDYYKTSSGGTPSRKNENFYINGKYNWIKTGELKDRFIISTDEKITEEAIKKSSAKLIDKGSLIMAMYGATIGKLGFTIEESTCNQACCVFNIRNNELSNEYLYFWLLTNREYIINISFGAAQQNLSQDLINNLNILKPDKYIVELFDKIIKLNFEEIKTLQVQNRNLIKQRDLLLPRLMSGKLKVE